MWESLVEPNAGVERKCPQSPPFGTPPAFKAPIRSHSSVCCWWCELTHEHAFRATATCSGAGNDSSAAFPWSFHYQVRDQIDMIFIQTL